MTERALTGTELKCLAKAAGTMTALCQISCMMGLAEAENNLDEVSKWIREPPLMTSDLRHYLREICNFCLRNLDEFETLEKSREEA